ncbi:MAG: ATP-binding protein, partial [Clostridium sp.]|nr:ATP-binding protein [Clostridium sp.]
IEVTLLVERLSRVFSKQDRYPNVKLLFEKHEDKIQGNLIMIESLLINLIENAMRACQENGEVKVIFLSEVSLNQSLIQVIDNGIGMEEAEINKISQPFYRIDKARSRKAGGVGLGVSLCQKIIEAHKGSLHYDSKVGEGTKVTVTLPMNILQVDNKSLIC